MNGNSNNRPLMPVEKLTDNRREISLFCPGKGKGQDLKRLYPELASVEEFKSLSTSELRFAWYYGIYFANSSNERIRIESSLNFSFWGKLRKDQYNDYIHGNFPDKVRVAIERMQKFDLDSRLKARFICEMTLYVWQKILDTDIATNKEATWGEKKQYVDVSSTILKELPTLIKQMESGFGVREAVFEKEVTEKFIESYHDSEKT